MKGRGNQRPVARYHPAIIALLKLPLIKGIVGGGYQPENNFNMADLPKEEAAAMIKDKPALADMVTMYRMAKNKMTAPLVKKLQSIFAAHGTKPPSYNKAHGGFDIEMYPNLNGAVDAVFGKKSSMYGILRADSSYGDHWDYAGVSLETCKDLLSSLPEHYVEAVPRYVAATYPEVIPDYTDDPDDPDTLDFSDSFSILSDKDDEIIAVLKNAVSEGRRYGAEGEAHEAAIKHLDGFDRDSNFSIVLGDDYDSPATLVCNNVEWVLQNADELADQGFSSETMDARDLDEPGYGWNEYDEEVAKERAEYELGTLLDPYVDQKAMTKFDTARREKADILNKQRMAEYTAKKKAAEKKAAKKAA